MGRCQVCGNEYDKTFTVTFESDPSAEHTFDSFECAIHALAPICEHCGCRIVGHGAEVPDGIYCCAHCAQQAGAEGLKDRG